MRVARLRTIPARPMAIESAIRPLMTTGKEDANPTKAATRPAMTAWKAEGWDMESVNREITKNGRASGKSGGHVPKDFVAQFLTARYPELTTCSGETSFVRLNNLYYQ